VLGSKTDLGFLEPILLHFGISKMALLCEINRVSDIDRAPAQDRMQDIFSLDWISLDEELLTLYYDKDPLAEYINLRELGHVTPNIFQTIVNTPDGPYIAADAFKRVSEKHYAVAQAVRNHFKNKFMLIRLHAKLLTQFQVDVEKMLEQPLVIHSSNVAAFCKLYDFYLEDKASEEIFKKAKPLPQRLEFYNPQGEITFIGSVDRKAKDSVYTTYYWLSVDQYLISKKVKQSEQAVWQYISKKGKIKIKGDLLTGITAGHDFKLAKIIGEHYEIYD